MLQDLVSNLIWVSKHEIITSISSVILMAIGSTFSVKLTCLEMIIMAILTLMEGLHVCQISPCLG